jgi:hypothetical protein
MNENTMFVKRKLLSQSITVTGASQVNTLTYNIPAGYRRAVGMYFNPARNFSCVLSSQKADNNILNGFSTLIGNYGFIEFLTDALETDILSLQTTLLDTFSSNFTATFTLSFM